MNKFKRFTECVALATHDFYAAAVIISSPVVNVVLSHEVMVEKYRENLPLSYRENAEVKRLLYCHTCDKWLTRVGKQNIITKDGGRNSVWDYVELPSDLEEWQPLVDAMAILTTKSTTQLGTLVKPNKRSYRKSQPNPRYETIYITSNVDILHHLHGDTPNYINSFVHQRHLNAITKLGELCSPEQVAHWQRCKERDESSLGEDVLHNLTKLLSLCGRISRSTAPNLNSAIQHLFEYEHTINHKRDITKWLLSNTI